MELNAYQKTVKKFDLFEVAPADKIDFAFLDKVLGLAGESGEVADKVKKILRDDEGCLTSESRFALAKELGDVLWYLATCARYICLPLDDIAKENIKKLEDRQKRGKIKGSGDAR
jgi:NTP pyrophosphatase (non-canonical NTP hydrolase)